MDEEQDASAVLGSRTKDNLQLPNLSVPSPFSIIEGVLSTWRKAITYVATVPPNYTLNHDKQA